MKNQFTKVMSERSDEQLIQILTSDRQKYTNPAIEAAEKEVEKRKLDTSYFRETSEKLILEKAKTQKAESDSASSGLRFVNYLIDVIAGYLVAFLVAVLISIFVPFDLAIYPMATIILLVASFFAYYIAMEVVFQKTLGKFITRTKVVTVNGQKPKEQDIILRTLYRMIPFDHISFLFTKNGLHDNLSKTKVIKEDRAA